MDTTFVSISAIGVRFRCPICDYRDVTMKFVRDHMRDCHKGKKEKEISPRKQEMRVKIKPPRIYRETMKEAMAYYKSYGGQFFKTGVVARVTYAEPRCYIRNLNSSLGVWEDRPCPKRFKRKKSKDSSRESTPAVAVTPKLVIPAKPKPVVNEWEILQQPTKDDPNYHPSSQKKKRKIKDSKEPDAKKMKKVDKSVIKENSQKSEERREKQGVPKVKLPGQICPIQSQLLILKSRLVCPEQFLSSSS